MTLSLDKPTTLPHVVIALGQFRALFYTTIFTYWSSISCLLIMAKILYEMPNFYNISFNQKLFFREKNTEKGFSRVNANYRCINPLSCGSQTNTCMLHWIDIGTIHLVTNIKVMQNNLLTGFRVLVFNVRHGCRYVLTHTSFFSL